MWAWIGEPPGKKLTCRWSVESLTLNLRSLAINRVIRLPGQLQFCIFCVTGPHSGEARLRLADFSQLEILRLNFPCLAIQNGQSPLHSETRFSGIPRIKIKGAIDFLAKRFMGMAK